MKNARLTQSYELGTSPVTGVGLSAAQTELDKALGAQVPAIVFDDAGTDEIAALLNGLVDTEFDKENLTALLTSKHLPEDWRVGEALAENFLIESRECFFPWPDSRDERKSGSSLPGADLVGFLTKSNEHRFAFGEVKTSAEAKYPPGAAYGRHGLKQQMEDLRDNRKIREDLVLYLTHRALNAPWQDKFCCAAKLFLKDSCDVRIFGILIRDVPPHEDDLRVRVTKLVEDCPAQMVVELIAIYLPPGSIATLAAKVVASRKTGEAE